MERRLKRGGISDVTVCAVNAGWMDIRNTNTDRCPHCKSSVVTSFGPTRMSCLVCYKDYIKPPASPASSLSLSSSPN
jgi:hypothetical protein